MTASPPAKRVANPGCWATGFLALARPLVRAGLIPADFPLMVHGVSGYSGGGKSMIEEFEKKDSPVFVETVQRSYALGLSHKHIPEMQALAGLDASAFVRARGGAFLSRHAGGIAAAALGAAGHAQPARHSCRAGQCLCRPAAGRSGEAWRKQPRSKSLDAELLAGSNGMKLFVFANEEAGQARLVAALDNLGKGAGGAAVQNLNIMLGLPETTGLYL